MNIKVSSEKSMYKMPEFVKHFDIRQKESVTMNLKLMRKFCV